MLSDRWRWSFTTPTTPRSWSAICGSRQSGGVLERLRPNLAGWPPPARHRDKTANAPAFDARAAQYVVLGVDPTQIHGLGPSLALKLIGECGNRSLRLAKRQTLHFYSLAPANKISGGKSPFDANAAIRQQSAAALLALAAVTGVCSHTHLPIAFIDGSPHRGRQSGAKAVTAMARKIATCSCSTTRCDMG